MKKLSNLINESFNANEVWIKTKLYDFLASEELTINNLKTFSSKLNIKFEDVLTTLFKINDSFFKEGKYINKLKEDPSFLVNSTELEIGIRFELEHTTDLNIARRIALDHLTDCSSYYTRLQKLEKNCEDSE